NRKRADDMAVHSRILLHQIAAREMHPVKNLEMAVLLYPRQRRMPERIDLDAANGAIVTASPGALLRGLPRRADAADEIDAGIGRALDLDRDLARPDAFTKRHHRASNPSSWHQSRATRMIISAVGSPAEPPARKNPEPQVRGFQR